MNQRVKDLLNVCGMSNEDLMEIYSDTNKSFYMQQFAELIVFECVNAVVDGTAEADHYAMRIEKHFDDSTSGILHFGIEK